MADQGERVPQLPAGENLTCSSSRRRATDAASTPPQNQEELANPNPGQNIAGGGVTLEVCSAFCFVVSSTCSCILYLH